MQRAAMSHVPAKGRLLRRVLSLLLVTWVLAASPPDTRAESTVEPVSVAPIRVEDLRRRLERLADDAMEGRATATEGARRAGAFLAAEMARIGLEPAGTDGYFQAFPVARPRLGDGNVLRVEGGGTAEAFDVETAWTPFSLSRSADVAGPLVFAGYGITAPARRWTDAEGNTVEGWDDYADVDVEGRVVLVLRKDPGWNDTRHASFAAKLANAAKHGAAALLLVNDRASARGDDVITPWNAPVGGAAGSGPIPFAFVKRRTAAALLGTDPEDLGTRERALLDRGPRSEVLDGRRVRLAVDLDTKATVQGRNVVGCLRGTDTDLSNEILVVGAHYDHVGYGHFGSRGGRGRIHPGADDNASGTAALLEVAEHLASPEHRPRRTVLFAAFSGEEIGLVGSRHFVAHPPVPLDRIVLMANLDMVGRSRERRVSVGGVGTARGLEAVVQSANEGIGLSLSTWASGNAPADSVVFFRKQIPVLFFFTGLHDDYHRPTDTPDKIVYPAYRDVTRLVAETVKRVADADRRLEYTDPPEPKRPPYLGVRLTEDRSVSGVVVAAVPAGGPAAAAGVRAGDRIVGLADHQIRTVRDLRQVIRDLAAGRAVSIDVMRGGKGLRLEVVPRKRGR